VDTSEDRPPSAECRGATNRRKKESGRGRGKETEEKEDALRCSPANHGVWGGSRRSEHSSFLRKKAAISRRTRKERREEKKRLSSWKRRKGEGQNWFNCARGSITVKEGFFQETRRGEEGSGREAKKTVRSANSKDFQQGSIFVEEEKGKILTLKGEETGKKKYRSDLKKSRRKLQVKMLRGSCSDRARKWRDTPQVYRRHSPKKEFPSSAVLRGKGDRGRVSKTR